MAECNSRPTCALHLQVDERLPWTVRRRREPSARVSTISRKKRVTQHVPTRRLRADTDDASVEQLALMREEVDRPNLVSDWPAAPHPRSTVHDAVLRNRSARHPDERHAVHPLDVSHGPRPRLARFPIPPAPQSLHLNWWGDVNS